MDFLTQLWLPIVLSAAAVWIASAIVWMALPHHKDDHRKLPDEGAFAGALRSLNIPPGNYGFPYCGGHAQRNDPEFQKKWKEGPVGMLSLWPPNPSMGKNMVLTFVLYLVVSALIAYLGWAVLPHGGLMPPPTFGKVMQALGTAGVLAYSFAFIPNALWFGQYPRAIAMRVLDGIAYGLITGAIFAALWPGH